MTPGTEPYDENSECDVDSGGTDIIHLEHEEVVVDNTISNKTTHGGNGLLGGVKLGSGAGFVATFTDSENFLVEPEVKIE